MRQGKGSIGVAVVMQDTGKAMRGVKEVIVHRARKCVVGFLLHQSGWFQHARAVPFSAVISFENGAVLVPSASSVIDIDQIPGALRFLERKPYAGSTLISTAGHKIGLIDDFYFDDDSGVVCGFDVLMKMTADAFSAPLFLPIDDDVFVGNEDIIINEDTIQRLLFELTESVNRNLSPLESPSTESMTSSPEIEKTAGTKVIHFGSGIDSVMPDDPDQLKVSREGSTLTIGFNQSIRVDESNVLRYREQIFQALSENESCHKLILDVKNVKYLPTSMLGLMATIKTIVSALEIVSSSPDGDKILSIAGVEPSITIPAIDNTHARAVRYVDRNTFVARPAASNSMTITRDGSSLKIGFDEFDSPDDLTIAQFREQIHRSLGEQEGCTSLIFDATNIRFFPSPMLGLIANLRRKVANIEILNASPTVVETMKIMGFDKFITIRVLNKS